VPVPALLNSQVMALAENVKLHIEVPAEESQQDRLAGLPDQNAPDRNAPEQNAPGDAGPNDEAESQMRRALGLLGDAPRQRPDVDRVDQPARSGERFGGGLHRRRFVQDGDIPVTVVRREPGHDAPAHRVIAPATGPTSSRLQRTEAALAAATAAREKAERSLNETLSVVRDLQTKIGHAELAKNEAVEALRRERELTTQLRARAEECEARLNEACDRARADDDAANGYQDQLSDERQARKAAEKALHAAEAARDAAEQLVMTLSEQPPKLSHAAASRSGRQPAEQTPAEPVRAETKRANPPRRGRVVAEPEATGVGTHRHRPVEIVAPQPEPVKWWLNTKPAPKRR